jgi:hypothetical protein
MFSCTISRCTHCVRGLATDLVGGDKWILEGSSVFLCKVFKRKEERYGDWGMLIKRASIRELVGTR